MGVCVACGAGTFQDQQGQETCQPCTPGSYCTEGAAAHLPCKEGTFSTATNLTSAGQCQQTSLGHYASTGSTVQIECSPGTVQPDAGKGACDRCAAGKYQPDDVDGREAGGGCAAIARPAR